MNQEIQINDINNSTDDNIILQYIKDFKAVKCLYCFQDNPKIFSPMQRMWLLFLQQHPPKNKSHNSPPKAMQTQKSIFATFY